MKHCDQATQKWKRDAIFRACLASASYVAILAAVPAAAQSAGGADTLETIVVTGTRIQASGFTAPTPTQVIGTEQIEKNAQPNIFTTIAQLPSLQGSSGTAVNTFSTSSGQQGLSSFSLRGLTPIRTLTLLDGQRVVGANVTGVPDISLFPQLLVQRVDVVTGGASASYGSDAVGGVVNFITDKRFTGIKANVQGGITTYGDNAQYLLQAAVGHNFLNDRLHVQVSGEYDHEDGIPPGGFGENAPNGRSWYHATTLVNTGITNNGSPQYLLRDHAQATGYSKYGLISAGPLQGTAFDANGQPFSFLYGSNGVPAKDASGNVTGCYIGFCLGGDRSGAVGIGASLQSGIKRLDGYTRIGFDLDSNNEIYATFNMARVTSNNQPNPGAQKSGLTMSCSNPYVPTLIQQACTANNITSFKYGTDNAMLPNIHVNTSRRQMRAVFGADGKLSLGDTSWRYDAYYEHGEEITDIRVRNILLTNRYNAAINATLLNGQIVCADATARANGCQPLNIFGGLAPSPSALSYIVPDKGPFQHTHQQQDVVSLNLNGEPFALWAGDVSVAFGGEYRRENYRVNADPYGAGITATNTYNSTYPADPVLATAGSNWFAGNYHDGTGTYDVKEAYLEINAPFLNSPQFGKASLNVAGRWTDYSTSGTVYTWKIGGTWDTPLEAVRLRAVMSNDVRAPNLSELFAAPTTTTVPSFTNPFNKTSVTILQNTIGNSALKPEIARNIEAGIVLSQPSWLPGFSASFDYYRIKLTKGISSLTADQIVNFCFNGINQTCGAFNFNPASGLPFVNVQQFNLASIFTEGFDLEGSYQFDLPDMVPGHFTLRGLATNIGTFLTDPGIPGTIPQQTAGTNSGATPHWKFLMTQSWDNGVFSFNLQERWFTDGVIDRKYVVCQTGCPVSTGNNPTLDNNFMSGAFYLDVGGTYSFTDSMTAYFKIDNLFDRDPTPSPQTNTGLDTNPALYDIAGRTFRVGVRFSM
ncbi:outer membrane receptor protein involved in Fe transport [Rhizomicrobium palustre]|uniref:Outer membrane receptor protein involved in Fe transport n=1 Tax=Rhizomicrobium palustre TaxID=189966 RepID=A0A846MZD9_9PROT|nr:TonB-dependent receptor [Rhizomicrobium palustre]NIK88372.1 outer membrane receptor protein involved in Fe transport [Rhizomicrobium palustre]